MYRLKSSWRDFSGWMRMQIYPEPCCSCCWELEARPERHICTSMPVRMAVDLVVLPREGSCGRVPGAGVAERIRDWKRGEKWRGNIFVIGRESADWFEWVEMADAQLIPHSALIWSRFPAEARLHRVDCLSECHVVMPEEFITPEPPEVLDYFTPNGLPVLYRGGVEPIPRSVLAFPLGELRGFYHERGMELPEGYVPYLGPYGQCKSDLSEMADFYSGFVTGREIDSPSFWYLSMLWRYVAARGVA